MRRPTVLYHGTSRRRFDEFIASEGLLPQRSAPGVYLTSSPMHAAAYGQAAVEIDVDDGEDASDVIILAVGLGDLDLELLGPDDHELADAIARGHDLLPAGVVDWRSISWDVSLAVCEQATYAGNIRSAVLRVGKAEVVDDESNWRPEAPRTSLAAVSC